MGAPKETIAEEEFLRQLTKSYAENTEGTESAEEEQKKAQRKSKEKTRV